MKSKRVLSVILSLFMLATMMTVVTLVPATQASASGIAVYSADTFSTTGGGNLNGGVNLNNYLENGNIYTFEFNVKPQDITTGAPIRVDIGFQSSGASPGSYGIYYLYNANGIYYPMYNSTWANENYTSIMSDIGSQGIDFKYCWNTVSGIIYGTVTYPNGYVKTYSFNIGVISNGNFGKFYAWSPNNAVTVSGLTISKQAEGEVVYEKSSWSVTGEHNYLWVEKDLNMKSGDTYLIDFDLQAPTGNPCFYFDWRNVSNTSKSGIASWNYTAVSGIYDDGNNDCIAIGTAPSWVKTLARAGGTTSYHYSILWNTQNASFDVVLRYETAGGVTGALQKKVTGSGTYASDDVLKFATGSGTATITNLTISRHNEPSVVYTAANGWTKGGAREETNGRLKLGKGSANAAEFTPTLEAGKKYEITYDVSGLYTTSGSWFKPFTLSMSAGGQTESNVLTYRMTGAWKDATTDQEYAVGSNGQNKILIDTATGEWKAYALGSKATYSGYTSSANNATKTYNAFSNLSDFTLKFYAQDTSAEFDTPYISNVQVKEVSDDTEFPIYQRAGDWNISGEHNYLTVGSQLDMSAGNTYLIQFGVQAPTGNPGFYFDWRDYANNSKAGISSWNYTAITGIYDDGANDCVAIGTAPSWADTVARSEGATSYQYSIIWDTTASTFDVAIHYETAGGVTGSMQRTVTGSGAFAANDVLKFATGTGTATVSDLTVYLYEEPNTVYTAENGWTKGGSKELSDGSLRIGKGTANAAVFTPTLEAGNKYEITYDVSGLYTKSGSWTKPFTVSLSAGGHTESSVLTYRMAGAWRDSTTDEEYASGSNGRNKIIIDTATGEWSTYALGSKATYSGYTSSANNTTRTYHAFEDVTDFSISFSSYDTSSSFDMPHISNVQVTDITPHPSGSYYEESYTTTGGGNYYEVPLDEIIRTGEVYEMTWNMKPAALTGHCGSVNVLGGDIDIRNSSNQNFGIFYLYDSGASALGMSDYNLIGNVADYTSGVTTNGIDMKLVWDTASGVASVEAAFPNHTFEYAFSPGVVEEYGKLTIGAPDTAVTVSHLSIQPQESGAPVLVPGSIRLFAGNVEQNAVNASVNTDKVTVDFDRNMLPADMTDTLIYVKNKATGVKVADTYEYANGVFTLHYATAFAPQTTYTVVVSRVRNMSGNQTAEVYEKDFTTGKGRVRADIVSVTQRGVAVTTKAGLAPGATKINIDYQSTDGTAPTLYIIVAYYNNSRMVHADLVTQATAAGTPDADFAVDYTAPTIGEAYDKVYFMVWNGFGVMKPLSDVLTLE